MSSKVIKKTVPNEPLVREKDDPKETPSNEIVVDGGQGQNQGKDDEIKLRGARNRIKRNKPFTMNASDGSSKSEKTETKPDGTIVRTIVEIKGNQKKTTVIQTKGGSTKTNTKIETIGGGGSSGGFGFSGFDDTGFDSFNQRWKEQVNQMNNFYNNFGNFGQGGFHYEYNSGSGNKNKGNKGYSNQWKYEWGSDSNNNKNNDKISKQDYWADNDNDNQSSSNKNNKKNDGWDYGWGADTNKKNDGWDYGWGADTSKKNDGWNYEWGTDNKPSSNTNNYERKQSETITGNYFQQSALEAHNKYRKKHHVGNLVLSKDLCDIAQRYAETLARTGNFAHSNAKYNGKNMGENLFACYGMKISGDGMTEDWYNEVSQYDFNNPGFIKGTGHFTQIVWKDTREVGFGYAQARDGYYYGVANYYPAGNYIGEFEENVFRA